MLFRAALDDGRALALAVRPASLTASIDTSFIVACDLAGRLYSVFREGHTFRRGLNGHVLHKWQDDEGRHREWLSESAADRLLNDAAALFARARDVARREGWDV